MFLWGKCGEYEWGGIVFQCQEWDGESDVALQLGRESWVTDIPMFVENLRIELKADVDLDLKLFACNDATQEKCNDEYTHNLVDNRGTCIAGYECTHDTHQTFDYGVRHFFRPVS